MPAFFRYEFALTIPSLWISRHAALPLLNLPPPTPLHAHAPSCFVSSDDQWCQLLAPIRHRLPGQRLCQHVHLQRDGVPERVPAICPVRRPLVFENGEQVLLREDADGDGRHE